MTSSVDIWGLTHYYLHMDRTNTKSKKMSKADYIKCADGTKHIWTWGGNFGNEAKTNRLVEGRKCSNCGLTKKIFADTGRRVNR